MNHERFSHRHGYNSEAADITICEDAPDEVRSAILIIAEGEMGLSPRLLRDVLCTVLRKLPDASNWSEYPNIWQECRWLMESAPWYRVYDFVEALWHRLEQSTDSEKAIRWAELVNEYFVEVGVGWRLADGQLERRGTEGFESSVDTARSALESAGHSTSRQEIHEALRDLSRRPVPDLTGSVQHAMAALECTARQVTGDPRATLGDIIKRHPNLVPKPLDVAIEKMWGYASEMARHVREGRTVDQPEAELIVGIASAICSYLVTTTK